MRWMVAALCALAALGLGAAPAAAQWGYGAGVGGNTSGTAAGFGGMYAPGYGTSGNGYSYSYGPPLPWSAGYPVYGVVYGHGSGYTPYLGGYGYSSPLTNNGNAYYNYPGTGYGSGTFGLPSYFASYRGLGRFFGPDVLQGSGSGYGGLSYPGSDSLGADVPQGSGSGYGSPYPGGGSLGPVLPLGTYDRLCMRDGEWVC